LKTTKFEVKVAVRYFRLQFEKGVGKSIAKILTEPVTNSDDSYKRMTSEERATNEAFGAITVIANRRKKKIIVIDHAQGMSKEEMQKFGQYGAESADRKSGWRTRSLFGKGLRDVLFTQKYGVVKSIKNNQSSVANFYYGALKRGSGEEQPIVEIEDHPPRVNQDLRFAWGIRKNGTAVEFRLRDDVSFPRKETLLEKLGKFYMLRMINSNPEREVSLKYIDSSGEETEDKVRYVFPPGNLIFPKKQLEMKFENGTFELELEIWRAENDLTQDMAGYEDREGGLLLLDEDENIMDLTLFRYDNDPAASKLFGKLKVKGAGEYIRSKLNSTPPEVILSEDREGFVRKHGFFKKLAETVEVILKPIVEDEERKRRSESEGFSPEALARYSRGIDFLNSLYQEKVGKADFGDGFTGRKPKLPDYIAFIRSELTVTENVLTPLALLINCGKFPEETQAVVLSENEKILVQPERFTIAKQSPDTPLSRKILRITGIEAGIQGKIKVTAMGHQADAIIRVVDKEIFYPPDGLAFKPSSLRLHEQSKRTLRLFVDSSKIPTGSTLKLTCNSSAFELQFDAIDFRENMKINEEIGCVEATISGKGVGEKGEVTAASGQYSDKAFVQVVKKDDGPETPKEGGRFKPPRFEAIPNLKVQTWIKSDGTILINTLDPLNSVYFGKEKPEDTVDVLSPNAKRHCQVRLADLVLDECLNQIVTDAWSKGTIEKRHPNNPELDIRQYVSEWKYNYGMEVHKHFVTISSDASESEPSRGHNDRMSKQES